MSRAPAPPPADPRLPVSLGLAGVCLVAFAVRSLGFPSVFPGGGEVVLMVGDGLYHARASLYALVNFPKLLVHDAYLGFPGGASFPSPPLPDFLAAAATWALRGDAALLDRVLAWMAPIFGALTTLVVYAGARVLLGPWASLGAAAIFALLPVAVGTSGVGDADHHARTNGIGAAMLACVLSLARGAERPRGALRARAAGLALARTAMLLSWSGSMLYLVLAEGSLLLVGGATRRRELLLAHAASAAATAALVAPVLLSLPRPIGGPWSAISLSWLHVCALGAVALVALVTAWLEARRTAPGAGRGLARLAAVGLGVGGACLFLPGLAAGLAPGVAFVATSEEGAYVTTELMPLFSLGDRRALQPATRYLAAFAYLLPLAPLAALLAARRTKVRAPALVLAAWVSLLGVLTVWQVRFGTDFAAPASIAFALALAALGSVLLRLRWPPLAARLAVGAALLALLWEPVWGTYLPGARGAWAFLQGRGPSGADAVLASPVGSLKRFLESVRQVTPETGGYLDEGASPAYGVLNRMRIGHAIRWWARRAPTADGLLHTVAPEHFADARAFFELHDEDEALRIAERLRARYVITMFFPGIPAGTLGARLQHHDGAAGGEPLAHFRLVTDGPRGGRPLSDLFGFPRPRRVVPYKLFEIVPGAVLEVAAPAGETVRATLALRTPSARSFQYHAKAQAGTDGRARLRVPYATDRGTPTGALAPYRITWDGPRGDGVQRVRVREDEVLGGATIRVAQPDGDDAPGP